MKKLTSEEYINKFKSKYGDLYDYSESIIKNSRNKIRIFCKNHGVFEITPKAHMTRGCPKCSGNKKLTKNEFIEISNEVHKKIYNYSLIDYKNNKTKVKILCKKHGVFEQLPCSHMKGHGCPKCANDLKKFKLHDIINKSNAIHDNKYDYSLVVYNNAKEKIKIRCKKHGIFQMSVNSHINKKYGCPFCKKSKGENLIESILKNLNIRFTRQKTFDDCKNKRNLAFDFFLPDFNICIEYNGKQHYHIIEYYGGIKSLEYYKIRDRIKKDYCSKHKIKLIIFKFDDSKNFILESLSLLKNV